MYKKGIFLNPKNSEDETPEWRRAVNEVYRLSAKGKTDVEITAKTKLDMHLVKRILEDDTIADKHARRMYSEKIPTIEKIIGSSLHVLNKTMGEIATKETVRKKMIRNVKDLELLKNVVKDLNILLRLELDKSTENVAIQGKVSHSYQETRAAIQELKKIDPVFDYPELPEPPKGTDVPE